ncbi:MAG: asparagine--tRNA ligase [candidate division WOR-3 bacterium]|nr:asparagine--tRNA ligase [candidate division WOR-3 bacterium]MDW7987965.1 asparagine--tRNA ligase [candidate division WOR-3 bacterium]
MMKKKLVLIRDIGNYEGREVTLAGWVYNRRSSGKVRFVLLRDGTGIIQCVFSEKDVAPDIFELSDRIPQESSVYVKGVVRKDLRAPGGYELVASNMEVIQIAEDYPITPKEHGIEFLMKYRHLWLRSRRQHAIILIRARLIRAIRDYFDNQGFILVDTPILTPAAVEGTTTLFEVDYFGMKTYLTQSGQLYNEPNAAAFNKVYCFGPTFRAEKSKTRRHLTEFWMVEPEVAFADLEDIMDLAEDFLCYIVARVLSECQEQFKVLERDITKLEAVKKPFPRLTYTEAVKKLNEHGNPTKWGDDFGGDEETILSSLYDRPLMITHYPAQCKAFYMKRDPNDENLALGVDVLAPEGYGEIIGGGEREDDLKTLEKRIMEHKLPREAFEWYLDTRRYGTFPHSGFGLGVERTVAWLCGLSHVRETIPYPRMLEKIYP